MANELIQGTVIAGSTSTQRNPFLKSPESQARKLAGVMAHANSAGTDFGVVREGTIMGRDDDNSFRPCPRTLANGAVAAATTITVYSTANWRVGDPIFDDGADSGETVASITSATVMEASGAVTIADQSVLGTGEASDTPVGILRRGVNTFEDKDAAGADILARQAITLIVGGAIVDESRLIGDAANNKALLTGGLTFD